MAILRTGSVLAALLLLPGCAAMRAALFDYDPYAASDPRSVVVVPVTHDPMAQSALLETITQPLAERGYYVFPVGMSAAVLKQAGYTGGLPSGMNFAEFSEASAPRITALMGADAALFVRVLEFRHESRYVGAEVVGTEYEDVFSVHLYYRLVDDHGQRLWKAIQMISYSKRPRGIWDWFGPSDTDRLKELTLTSHRAVIEGRRNRIGKPSGGLPPPMLVGPYHPEYAADRARRGGAPQP